VTARTWAYFDTSVIVKRYVREAGSPRARVLLLRHRVLTSALTPLEATSALRRRRDAGDLADRDFTAAVSRLRQDRAHWTLVEVSPLVLDRAEDLVAGTAVAALDAVHLASALVFGSMRQRSLPFVTADGRQRGAAGLAALDLVWVE
jgi:predicted nucleic acid-binding protein